jgi:hypothetical protein
LEDYTRRLKALETELLRRPELSYAYRQRVARLIVELTDGEPSDPDHLAQIEQLERELMVYADSRRRSGGNGAADSHAPAEGLVGESSQPRLATVADVMSWIDSQTAGRVTVIGGLGQHIAGRLAATRQPRHVDYRFVYPAPAGFNHLGSEDVSASHLRMFREGEFKTLLEWRKALDTAGGSESLVVQPYISQEVAETCIVMLEPDHGPARIAYWSEGLLASLTVANREAAMPATVVTAGSALFDGFRSLVERIVSSASAYHQHELVVKCADSDRLLAPDGYPKPTRKLFCRFDVPSRVAEEEADELEGVPVALVALHAPYRGHRGLWLQTRDRRNSRDGFGTLSLMSTRLYASDLLAGLNDGTRGEPISLSRDSGYSPTSADDATGLLYDRLARAYDERPDGAVKFPVPLAAFRRAARRECYSTLGLDIGEGRLVHHPLQDGDDVVYLRTPPIMVELFSVRLSWEHDGLHQIEERRPFAELVPVRWPNDIDDLPDDRLNGFLRKNRREQFFRGIIDGLT